jgi:ComF family protein
MLIGPGKELTRLHRIDTIVPVHLHYKRMRQRGFNQASLLARRLGSLLKIPVDYSSLKRTRWTDPQIGLSRNQRAANVKGAFSLKATEKIKGKGILLLDDVLTTGGSLLKATDAARKQDLEVSHAFVIVDRSEADPSTHLSQHGLHLFSLLTLDDLKRTVPSSP